MSPAYSPDRTRLVAGFLVLPIAQGLVAYVALSLSDLFTNGDGFLALPRTAKSSAVAVGVAGAWLTLLIAVPVVLSMLQRGRPSLGRLLGIGTLIGNAPFAFYVLAFILPATVGHFAQGTLSERLMPVSDLLAGTLRAVGLGSSFGLFSAAVFWVVAIRDPHDRPSRAP